MSWLEIQSDSHFSLDNIPFGIISTRRASNPRPAIAIGDFALDLRLFSRWGGFSPLEAIGKHLSVFEHETLNSFAELGQSVHEEVRRYLQSVFSASTEYGHLLRDRPELREQALVPLADCTMHLPMSIGDYTDFYAGIYHAQTMGTYLRGPAMPLQPNYKHVPVGYHGRASTIVVSGTPIHRPKGQILEDPTAEVKTPVMAPSRKLDIELELGAFLCMGNKMSEQVPIETASRHVFGYVLVNDWSARDVQAWEAVPLGPFLSKSFATSISPWIVLHSALDPFSCQGIEPGDRKTILPYLRESRAENVYDIELEVDLVVNGEASSLCRTNSRNLLWSFGQMLAHHTINGCAMRAGDLLASGTISGRDPGSRGALMEANENGRKALSFGIFERLFLEDEDEVVIRGRCGQRGHYVGFGECRGRIKSALNI